MNLEDFAYQEDDRWYVNPQVSLDEQNAFINNIRNLQAKDNMQIEQQTRGLGTQVPSQLGGLVGAGSYFKSRYQTPQTNQAIADLKEAAQKQALSQVLSNEVAKAKKKYQDAYRAANISSQVQSPLYDATADVTGDVQHNSDSESAEQYNLVFGDEIATIGPFILRRNPNESVESWTKRVGEWADRIQRYGSPDAGPESPLN